MQITWVKCFFMAFFFCFNCEVFEQFCLVGFVFIIVIYFYNHINISAVFAMIRFLGFSFEFVFWPEFILCYWPCVFAFVCFCFCFVFWLFLVVFYSKTFYTYCEYFQNKKTFSFFISNITFPGYTQLNIDHREEYDREELYRLHEAELINQMLFLKFWNSSNKPFNQNSDALKISKMKSRWLGLSMTSSVTKLL